jgi:hypothetical protein
MPNVPPETLRSGRCRPTQMDERASVDVDRGSVVLTPRGDARFVTRLKEGGNYKMTLRMGSLKGATRPFIAQRQRRLKVRTTRCMTWTHDASTGLIFPLYHFPSRRRSTFVRPLTDVSHEPHSFHWKTEHRSRPS